MSENLPVILIELVLVFGGVLAFGWCQLRSVRRDREAASARRDQDQDQGQDQDRAGQAISDAGDAQDDQRRP